MSALDWIRSKAVIVNQDAWTNDDGMRISTVTYGFRGRLPKRMMPQLKNPALITGEKVNETLALNGPYRSDYGKCEYTRTEYKIHYRQA